MTPAMNFEVALDLLIATAITAFDTTTPSLDGLSRSRLITASFSQQRPPPFPCSN